MKAIYNLVGAYTSGPSVTLDPMKPFEDFQKQFSQAIDKFKRVDALRLLTALGPISKQFTNSRFFTEMFIQYLETPNQIDRVSLLCSSLGLFDMLTPFARLAEIAANLSLQNFHQVDEQIRHMERFLRESKGPQFTVYVQEQLEFFQIERRSEIVMLLTHLQHYLHREPPYEKVVASLEDTLKKV